MGGEGGVSSIQRGEYIPCFLCKIVVVGVVEVVVVFVAKRIRWGKPGDLPFYGR